MNKSTIVKYKNEIAVILLVLLTIFPAGKLLSEIYSEYFISNNLKQLEYSIYKSNSNGKSITLVFWKCEGNKIKVLQRDHFTGVECIGYVTEKNNKIFYFRDSELISKIIIIDNYTFQLQTEIYNSLW